MVNILSPELDEGLSQSVVPVCVLVVSTEVLKGNSHFYKKVLYFMR